MATTTGRRPHGTAWGAFAYQGLGDRAAALWCYDQALELYLRLGDRYCTAETLVRMGDTHFARDDAPAAAIAWRRAREIFTELGHSDAETVEAKLAGLQR